MTLRLSIVYNSCSKKFNVSGSTDIRVVTTVQAPTASFARGNCRGSNFCQGTFERKITARKCLLQVAWEAEQPNLSGGLICYPLNSLLPFTLWPRHWETSYGFSLAFSLLTTQCYSAPIKSPGFLNHGKHHPHHPSHIMTAAKRAAVCLLCVSRQKPDSILGACKCSSACSILSTHHFLKLLIHKLDSGLE